MSPERLPARQVKATRRPSPPSTGTTTSAPSVSSAARSKGPIPFALAKSGSPFASSTWTSVLIRAKAVRRLAPAHEERREGVARAPVRRERLGVEQRVDPFPRAPHQLLDAATLGELRPEVREALAERVLLREEEAVEPGPEPAVGRHAERGEGHRERDLSGRGIDADRSVCGCGETRHQQRRSAHQSHGEQRERGGGADQAVDVEPVVADDRHDDADRDRLEERAREAFPGAELELDAERETEAEEGVGDEGDEDAVEEPAELAALERPREPVGADQSAEARRA